MRYCILFLAISSLLFSATQSDRSKILTAVSGEWIAQGLYTAVKLDVATHLIKGSKHIEELANLTHSNEESLYRLMRLLAGEGIFKEEENRFFSNTKSSELLAENHPQSIKQLILFYAEEMSKSFHQLLPCIKEGKPAFELEFHTPVSIISKIIPLLENLSMLQ